MDNVSMGLVLEQTLNETNELLQELIQEFGIEGATIMHRDSESLRDPLPTYQDFSSRHPNFPLSQSAALLELVRVQSIVLSNLHGEIENLRQSIDSITHHNTKGNFERWDHTDCPVDACLVSEFVDQAVAEDLGIEPKGFVKFLKDLEIENARKEAARIEAIRKKNLQIEYEKKAEVLERDRQRAEREAKAREDEATRLRLQYELEKSLAEEVD